MSYIWLALCFPHCNFNYYIIIIVLENYINNLFLDFLFVSFVSVHYRLVVERRRLLKTYCSLCISTQHCTMYTHAMFVAIVDYIHVTRNSTHTNVMTRPMYKINTYLTVLM